MSRQKPPVSEWIVSERKRLGWKVEELSRRLLSAGYPAEISTIRVWEAGRRPREDTIAALEQLFGSPAPSDDEPAGLVEAIREQAAAMRELVAELRVDREQRQGQAEGLAVVLAGLADTLERLRPAPVGRRQ